EETASIIELTLFDWLTPLIVTGGRRQLEDEDLWELHSQDRAAIATQTYQKHKRRKILRSLASAFRKDVFELTIYSLLWGLLIFTPPVFMQYLLKYLEDPTTASRSMAWFYAAALISGFILANVFMLQGRRLGQRMAVRSTAILSCEVSQKCLRRQINAPQQAKTEDNEKEGGEWDTGAVINLLSVDVRNIYQFLANVYALIGGTVQVVIVLVLLWRIVGIVASVGVGIIILTLFACEFWSRKLSVVYESLIKITDERLTIISEASIGTPCIRQMLQSIRMVKFFAWEPQFLQRISKVRQKELALAWKRMLYSTANMITVGGGPVLITVSVLFVYTIILGNTLTASVAFTTLSLLNMMRTIVWTLPQTIMWAVQANVSSGRIGEFLALPEITDQAVIDARSNANINGKERIALECAEFCWLPADTVAVNVTDDNANDNIATPFALRDIDIDFVPGELNVIAGQTGSGKTSLLMALLGEMPRVRGTVHLPRRRTITSELGTPGGNIAYVAQQAWLRNVSIRDNILFGQTYDEDRYRRVLHACALERDLEILDAGDRTQIGEKGITLSGGQKQRVALARAVYSPAQHIIMDDCLSAVDIHTAKHIVEHCLLGPLLQGRTRILVTHHVDLCMNDAAFGVILKEGRVIAKGPAAEVLPTDSALLSHAKGKQALADSNTTAELASLETAVVQLKHDGILTEEEDHAQGSVELKHYLAYFRASGGYKLWIIGALFCALAPVVDALQTYILRMWTDGTLKHASDGLYISVYSAAAALSLLMRLVSSIIMYIAALKSCRTLHDALTKRVSGATVRFFDKTPTGRVMNRFSKDIAAIDQELPDNIVYLAVDIFVTALSLPTVAVILPTYLIPVVVIAIVFMLAAVMYLRSSRELKRIESVSKSPYLSLATEILSGAVTIRAFNMEHWFNVENVTRIDTMNRPTYLLAMATLWLTSAMTWIGAFSILACCVLFLGFGGTVTAGTAGFVLTYTLSFAEAMAWTVMECSQLEVLMNCMERITEYLEIEQEPAAIVEDNRPPKSWPHHGKIHVDQLTVKYAEDQSPVLHDVTLDIKPGERVGIVGRTGAGKSTLSLTFFRFIEAASGRIVLDDVDISRIGLHDLRSRLTIIPQDPVLFSGTIRSNLDPVSEHDDAAIWAALRRCHLIGQDADEEKPPGLETLDSPVLEHGTNFSHGQRQLLAMARALLRESRVIIMDEATASVDFETDSKIQTTIREEFKQSTLLCIAHRLRTVIDYDRILVLDAGRVVEYDTPLALIQCEGGAFRSLCEGTGELDALVRLAESSRASSAAQIAV
ncbi:P-loop containing nucleoside triphosphate hydrolase protein, partial [Thamnocephalis sphaerospora]